MAALRIGKFALYAGKQARGYNGQNQPWMGFCYGSWLPRLKGGRYPGCVYYDLCWLCFHASIYKDTPNAHE